MNRILLILFSILLFACSTTTVEYRTATTALRNDRDFAKAEDFAKKALKVAPEDALPAYFLAMEVYGAPSSPKKDYKQAAYYFEKAIEIDNIDGEDQKLEESKIVEGSDGQLQELKTIKQGVEYYSYNLWVETFNSGITLISQGKNEQAIEMFLTAVKFSPLEAKNYNALATLYFETKDFEQAMLNAEQALAIDPSFPALWSIKGSIAMSNGDDITAEEMFRKAYNVAIDNKESAENLSAHMSRLFDILFKNNKKDEALLLNEQLIASDPENVDLYRNAGAVYQNILNDAVLQASDNLNKLNNLNELELENLKEQFNDCINFAQKAREMFLMSSELEIDEIESEMFYTEAKKLKIKIKDIKNIIKNIDKKLDESE